VSQLYVMCPECYLELPLRKTVGEEAYFMTVLGNVLDEASIASVVQTHAILSLETPITEVHFVHDPQCSVVKDNSSASASLEELIHKNRSFIAESAPDLPGVHFWCIRSRLSDGTLELASI